MQAVAICHLGRPVHGPLNEVAAALTPAVRSKPAACVKITLSCALYIQTLIPTVRSVYQPHCLSGHIYSSFSHLVARRCLTS